jgi:8-oxo-dGTP pyrophosphatase MutT (NUDIX family)
MLSAPNVAPTAAAAVVVVDEGCVLLVQHAYRDRAWHLPGGIVDPGETPWQAAVRELEEEVGLIADGFVEISKWATAICTSVPASGSNIVLDGVPFAGRSCDVAGMGLADEQIVEFDA